MARARRKRRTNGIEKIPGGSLDQEIASIMNQTHAGQDCGILKPPADPFRATRQVEHKPGHNGISETVWP